ncbi:hypothetical protein BO71DRAFT_333327, partial [Aspergillus ellipticus CBS 707.79]
PQSLTVPPNPTTPGPLLEHYIFNGHSFKDHWAFWLPLPAYPTTTGTKLHAAGDVLISSIFKIKRSYDFRKSADVSTKQLPLQWIETNYFEDEEVVLNAGVEKIDYAAVCGFERVLEGSLKSVDQSQEDGELGVMEIGKKGAKGRVVLRDCQSWDVEAAEVLVKGRILGGDVLEYLRGIRQ